MQVFKLQFELQPIIEEEEKNRDNSNNNSKNNIILYIPLHRKMKKMGLPELAVRHKMMHNGMTTEEIDLFIPSLFSTETSTLVPSVDLEPYRYNRLQWRGGGER
jgi:hypothetical protein